MAGQRKYSSETLVRVLSLITEAMDLLDATGISPPAAAHLALAQQELRRVPRG